MTVKKEKFIPGYSRYKVSDDGTVFHLTNDFNTWKKKKLRLNNDGYMSVRLNESGNKRSYLVHRLVAVAFVQNKTGINELKSLQVHHLDGNRTDNRACALKWVTQEEHDKLTQKRRLNP